MRNACLDKVTISPGATGKRVFIGSDLSPASSRHEREMPERYYMEGITSRMSSAWRPDLRWKATSLTSTRSPPSSRALL